MSTEDGPVASLRRGAKRAWQTPWAAPQLRLSVGITLESSVRTLVANLRCMRFQQLQIGFVSWSIAAMLVSEAQAVVIATSRGLGADAEVRDHQPTTNFGASSELGTRVVDNFPLGNANDGSDRFSAMYLKFDVTGQGSLPSPTASLRLTYRNSNLTLSRIHDTTPPGNNTNYRTGLAFYGLDRDDVGNNWSEATITYANAPGLANGGDFNNGTKDFDFVDPKQRLYGYKTVNLLNAHDDPTFLHTVLYSHIARKHIPAPKANFVKLAVNGELVDFRRGKVLSKSDVYGYGTEAATQLNFVDPPLFACSVPRGPPILAIFAFGISS